MYKLPLPSSALHTFMKAMALSLSASDVDCPQYLQDGNSAAETLL